MVKVLTFGTTCLYAAYLCQPKGTESCYWESQRAKLFDANLRNIDTQYKIDDEKKA